MWVRIPLPSGICLFVIDQYKINILYFSHEASGSGGICDRKQSFGSNTKTLNTGIVTNLNYGNTMTTTVTEITLAHEIGHNFGSKVGKYLFFNSAHKFHHFIRTALLPPMRQKLLSVCVSNKDEISQNLLQGLSSY